MRFSRSFWCACCAFANSAVSLFFSSNKFAHSFVSASNRPLSPTNGCGECSTASFSGCCSGCAGCSTVGCGTACLALAFGPRASLNEAGSGIVDWTAGSASGVGGGAGASAAGVFSSAAASIAFGDSIGWTLSGMIAPNQFCFARFSAASPGGNMLCRFFGSAGSFGASPGAVASAFSFSAMILLACCRSLMVWLAGGTALKNVCPALSAAGWSVSALRLRTRSSNFFHGKKISTSSSGPISLLKMSGQRLAICESGIVALPSARFAESSLILKKIRRV